MFPQNEKPERGYVRMFPWNENRNEGTFAKTTLLRNRPFVSRQALSSVARSKGISLCTYGPGSSSRISPVTGVGPYFDVPQPKQSLDKIALCLCSFSGCTRRRSYPAKGRVSTFLAPSFSPLLLRTLLRTPLPTETLTRCLLRTHDPPWCAPYFCVPEKRSYSRSFWRVLGYCPNRKNY